MKHLPEIIFATNVNNFEENCLLVFRWQFDQNKVYRDYCRYIGILKAEDVTSLLQIPFIPVSFFKTKKVRSFEETPDLLFKSSATGNTGQSEHALLNRFIYKKSFTQTFEKHFGPSNQLCILGLLPSYLEREGSSLIYMVQHLMKLSAHPLNGFFLFEHEALMERIQFLESKKQNYLLFGVSFALLDFVKKHPLSMRYGKVIETGGMKGRKKEITRAELMEALSFGFGSNQIYSEYGMTELLSQAYADINGLYEAPAWMKISISDLNDPFCFLPEGKTGIVNIIDLANIESCAFIQSSDLGRVHKDGSFEILGRADHSDIRGCALMVS